MNWWRRFKNWLHRPRVVRFKLTDPDSGGSVTGKLTIYDMGIGVQFDGFHMVEAYDEQAELVWIEQYNNRLTVNIWPDSLCADCETISLEDARNEPGVELEEEPEFVGCWACGREKDGPECEKCGNHVCDQCAVLIEESYYCPACAKVIWE